MDRALLDTMPDLTILSQKLTQSKKVLMYKLKEPDHALNRILSSTPADPILTKLARITKYSGLTAEHYDPSAKGAQMTTDPLTIIVKNVPLEYSREDIIDALPQETRDKINQARRITNNHTGEPSSFLRISLTDTNLTKQLLEEGLRAIGRVFPCEPPWPRPNVPRCFKCQGLGHSSHTCQSQFKCPKCGEEHEIKDCQAAKTHYNCPNCKGKHAAWSATCPVVKNFINERKEKEMQKALLAPENQPVTKKYMNTFSEAVQTKMNRVEEHTERQTKNTEEIKLSIESNRDQLMKTMIDLQTTLIQRIEQIHEDLINLQKTQSQETAKQMSKSQHNTRHDEKTQTIPHRNQTNPRTNRLPSCTTITRTLSSSRHQ
jgi:predicted RNA-binding Zn-ribbon protein involved in translation (DUF1610 family)